MTTLVDRPSDGAREVHDRLETAYFGLAATSARWIGKRTPHAVMGGFAGLDSATMNRVAMLDAPDEATALATLDEAGAFFGARQLPWSVQLTPFSRPVGMPLVVKRLGMTLASELSVMTFSRLAEYPPTRHDGFEVREMGLDEMPRFTQLTIDAFRMPPRFLAALTDVNRAWVEHGGRAFVAEAAGSAVGTALLTRHDGVAGVYNVGTLPRWRRRGVARALMAEVLAAYAERPADALTLQVARGSAAESFYERLGFVTRYGWQLYATEG